MQTLALMIKLLNVFIYIINKIYLKLSLKRFKYKIYLKFIILKLFAINKKSTEKTSMLLIFKNQHNHKKKGKLF